jgi:acetolactate synthase small subunit
MPLMTQTITALIYARPTVVYRTISLCRRYRAQIESVTVARTEQRDISQMTLVVLGAPIAPLVAQLRKVVDVLEVYSTGERAGTVADQQSPGSETTPHFSSHTAQADGAF